MTAPAPAPAFSVLVVCTGNVCRSPLAERLGRARLAARLDDPDAVRLASAGTRAVVGAAMDPQAAQVLERLGGDPTGFRARQLDDGMAAGADLVLTMSRNNRREVLSRAPRALSRTFTLREAAGLLDLVGPETVEPPSDDPARALVRRMAAARAAWRSSAADDIRDPIGQSPDVHASVGAAIADALLPVLDRLATALAQGRPRPAHATAGGRTS